MCLVYYDVFTEIFNCRAWERSRDPKNMHITDSFNGGTRSGDAWGIGLCALAKGGARDGSDRSGRACSGDAWSICLCAQANLSLAIVLVPAMAVIGMAVLAVLCRPLWTGHYVPGHRAPTCKEKGKYQHMRTNGKYTERKP